jgi:hypothetical protein
MDGVAREEPVRGPAEEAVDRLLGRGFLDDLMSEVDEGGVQLVPLQTFWQAGCEGMIGV